MKNLLTLTFVFGLFGLAQGQTGWNWSTQEYYGQSRGPVPTKYDGQYGHPSTQCYYDSGCQVPVYNVDPNICFEPGWDFGGYFSAMFADDLADDAIGGGILLSYFFDRNIGLEMNYSAFGQAENLHVFNLNGIYRLPINSCFCGGIAPYVFGGWGFVANGEFDNLFDVGAGVEWRFQSWGCTALFSDYSYNFVEKGFDFQQLRVGFKLPF